METLYQQYFDALPCYLSVQNRALKVVAANRQFRKDFGDWEGRYCYQVYKHRPEKCEVCPVERSFRDGERHTSEEQVVCLNGSQVSVIVYTTPIKNEQGEIISVMEMSTDITEIKALQKQLSESRHRCRMFFEEVPCFISIQDRDLNIVDANRLHREAFGSFLGCKCYEIYKHRSEECYPCVVRQTFEDGLVHVHEEVVTGKDGKPINVLVHTAPLRTLNGEIDSVIEMSADITRLRELQSQLTSTGLLISSISHGIKGLLNGMDGGIYLVGSGFKSGDTKRLQKGWEIVKRNLERIRSMVLDILYYAKDREPNWAELSAIDLVKEVCEVAEGKAREQNIVFECEIDPVGATFNGDHNALRAALINLLENSLDACRIDRKKDRHCIILRMNSTSEAVCFEVQDNGIGMDRETKEKAFSLFFSSKGAEGTGLGLFVAHKITRAHNGQLRLESAPDIGTKFVLELPRQRRCDTPAEEKPSDMKSY